MALGVWTDNHALITDRAAQFDQLSGSPTPSQTIEHRIVSQARSSYKNVDYEGKKTRVQ